MSHGGIATRKSCARPWFFLCVAMKSTRSTQISRWFGNYPDGLESFQVIWKFSRWSGNFPDDLKTFRCSLGQRTLKTYWRTLRAHSENNHMWERTHLPRRATAIFSSQQELFMPWFTSLADSMFLIFTQPTESFKFLISPLLMQLVSQE